MHAHRTTARLAVIAATAGVVAAPASAQAATHRRDSIHATHRRTALVTPLRRVIRKAATEPGAVSAKPPLRRCTGGGPLSRRADLIKDKTRYRLSTYGTCIGYIEY